MVIAAFLPVDWTNAVIIPLVMTIALGSLLAIWTGVLVTRLAAFNQTRMNAIRSVGSLYRLVLAADKAEFHRIQHDVGFELTGCQMEALYMRQGRLNGYIEHIRNQVTSLDLTEIGNALTEDGIVDPVARKEAFFASIKLKSSAWADMLFDLTPQWSPILAVTRQLRSKESVSYHFPERLSVIEGRLVEERTRAGAMQRSPSNQGGPSKG